MKVLRDFCTPISLLEMVSAAATGTIPQRAVCITFDDGYVDNLTKALPILEQNDIPATFFVVVGALGNQFWWDLLRYLVYEPEALPNQLTLTIDNQPYKWQPQSTTAGRESFFYDLFRLLRPLTDDARTLILAELLNWTGNSIAEIDGTRPLTIAELTELAKGKRVTIGAHTVGHPSLSSLSPAQQECEIKQGKSQLESITGQDIITFSYPFGMPTDYSLETVELVKQAGFQCACTNILDVVRSNCDQFQLRRYWIRNWNSQQFKKRILRWI